MSMGELRVLVQRNRKKTMMSESTVCSAVDVLCIEVRFSKVVCWVCNA